MMKYLCLLILLTGLSGCYEDSDVVLHESGVYKGKIDNYKTTAAERNTILAERFKQVQTDR